MAESISAERALNPQGKRGSGQMAIRDDGMLMEANQHILKEPNWRLYYGKADASIEERVAYVQKFHDSRRAAVEMETGAFNIGTATREQLIDFAGNEYGARLDPKLTLAELRRAIGDMAAKEGALVAPQTNGAAGAPVLPQVAPPVGIKAK